MNAVCFSSNEINTKQTAWYKYYTINANGISIAEKLNIWNAWKTELK